MTTIVTPSFRADSCNDCISACFVCARAAGASEPELLAALASGSWCAAHTAKLHDEHEARVQAQRDAIKAHEAREAQAFAAQGLVIEADRRAARRDDFLQKFRRD